MKKTGESTAVFTLGMHRSGTSAAMGALGILGVELGGNLYRPQKNVNERGFFEDREVVEINEAIMRVIASRWDDPLGYEHDWWRHPSLDRYKSKIDRIVRRKCRSGPTWGMKDPRFCRLMPIWLEQLHAARVTPRIIFIYRHPLEVAHSLRRRNGFEIEKSLILWLRYNLEAEHHTRDCARVFVSYNQLLADPVSTLERVCNDLKFDVLPVDSQTREKLAGFLSGDLRHHVNQQPIMGSEIEKLAELTYQTFEQTHSGTEKLDSDRLQGNLRTLEAELGRLPKWINDELKLLGERGAYFEHVFLEAYESVWWKLSRPLRVVEKTLRGSDRLSEPSGSPD